jgi:hypothetical protein
MLKLSAIALFTNLCGASFAAADGPAPPTNEQLEFFENKVRPLLVDKRKENSKQACVLIRFRGYSRVEIQDLP